MNLTSKKSLAIQLAGLFLLDLLTYVNTFNHGYSLDDFLISNNLPANESGMEGIRTIFNSAYNNVDYRPVSILSFTLERNIFGELTPKVSHRVNTFLYALCCLLLFVCIRKLPVKNAPLIALIATAIFVVHPIHSNVISSIKNRDNILSLALSLCSLICIIHMIGFSHRKRVIEVLVKSALVLFSLGIFLLATTAKLDAASLIIILPLTFLVFSKKRMWLLYSALFGFIAFRAFMFIRFKIITPMLDSDTFKTSVDVTENTVVQYEALSGKISAALISIFYYLKFHLIPAGYYYYFGFDMIPVGQIFIWQNIVAIVFIIVSLVGFIYYFKRNPVLSYGIGFYFAGLLYCLNVYTPVAGIVAPRMAFLASVGFCLALAALLIMAGKRLEGELPLKTWDARRISLTFTALLMLIYLPFTIHRNSAWKDIFTLIDRDIEHLEKSFEGQRIACMNYLDRSSWANLSPEEAKSYVQRSLRHCSLASKVYDNNQFVEETIGVAHFQLGEYRASFDQFKSVLSNFDTTEVSMESLGDILDISNRPDSAAYYFKQLIDLSPDYDVGYFKYTTAMVKSGRYDEAIQSHLDFARADPTLRFPYESLGYLYALKKDTLAATQHFLYAVDKGSPNQQYVTAMQPYFQNKGLMNDWQRLMDGERVPLDVLLQPGRSEVQ